MNSLNRDREEDKYKDWENSKECNLCGGSWVMRGPNDQTWDKQCASCHFIPSYWKSQFVNEYCDPNDADLLMQELLELFDNVKNQFIKDNSL